MNTATLAPTNRTSARRRLSNGKGAFTRYRRPRACSSRLTRHSGPVSRPRLLRIDRRVASEEAQDASGSLPTQTIITLAAVLIVSGTRWRRGKLGRMDATGWSPAEARLLRVHEELRYASGADQGAPILDGRINYHWVTSPAELGLRKMMLEAGINRVRDAAGRDGPRRPALAIRSSPWKAGDVSAPWHDEFDLDHGHVRYFGDHKPGTLGIPGATSGNRALLQAWHSHNGVNRQQRLQAPPLLLFRAFTVHPSKGGAIHKGHVEFCGVALIERLEYVVQRDPRTGRSFPNIAVDLAVLSGNSEDAVDMRWIDDRRDPNLGLEQTLRFAPESWIRWVAEGRAAIPRVRRRVLSSRVQSKREQLPDSDSHEERALLQVYKHFLERRHAFEMLASRVAAQVLGNSGASYHPGWLTRSGGDGGVDFVGRLDVGAAGANTPIVVLGQAKCVAPESSVSADQVARVVARLRRGWIGVFVTTGVFSERAQIEIIDDQYPLVLVPGAKLAKEVLRMAAADHDGDLQALLDSVTSEYEGAITHRRPEEILNDAAG